jgi:hypothetical protein
MTPQCFMCIVFGLKFFDMARPLADVFKGDMSALMGENIELLPGAALGGYDIALFGPSPAAKARADYMLIDAGLSFELKSDLKKACRGFTSGLF